MAEESTPIFESIRNQRARQEFFSAPDASARQAAVDALCARAENPSDEYDGHHGTDRSGASLAWLRDNDPANYDRILAKIAAEGGAPDEH